MVKKEIFVTKPFLPPIKEYEKYIAEIFKSTQLTNEGPYVLELQKKLKDFLNVPNLEYVTNGTIALQIAIESLEISGGEIITTPFTYIATISSIIWQKCKPVFVDIEPNNFTIDCNKIEKAITANTRAILPVHVFGYACNIEKIAEIAKEYNLKVIYDAAHAFGSSYKGKSLLSYGDISTCSFHATKVYHTIEGGCCVTPFNQISKKISLIKKFGHIGDKFYLVGINGKQSEFNAAMGLVNLKYLTNCIQRRKIVSEKYDYFLSNKVGRPCRQKDLSYNYSYYPVVFKSFDVLKKVNNNLLKDGIHIRRYFYPSLNKLGFYDKFFNCPISEDISSRIACLPLYPDLSSNSVELISNLINEII